MTNATAKAKLNNVLVGKKNDKLVLTVDVSKFLNGELTQEMSSASGNSYRVAGNPSALIKLEGEFEGLTIKLDLFAPKKTYDEKQAFRAQQALAREAVAQIENNKEAVKALEGVGISNDILMQAIALIQAQNATKKAE